MGYSIPNISIWKISGKLSLPVKVLNANSHFELKYTSIKSDLILV